MERWEVLKNNSQSKYRVAETMRKLRRTFGRKEASSAAVVIKFIKKVRETGMLPAIYLETQEVQLLTEHNWTPVALL